MYNLCIFIFIVYAMSYSVSEILLKHQRHVVPASRRKPHISKTSQAKRNKTLKAKTAKQLRKANHQTTFNNKKPSSYKTQKTRTGKRPVRVLLYREILFYTHNFFHCETSFSILKAAFAGLVEGSLYGIIFISG